MLLQNFEKFLQHFVFFLSIFSKEEEIQKILAWILETQRREVA